MDYLELGIQSEPNQQKHGSTSDQINLDVRLDDSAAAASQNFDLFLLRTRAD